ncbi:hypothetical protein KIN20_020715 [Parelaphostrongylus tenuis]|uniref:Uncharacterized protein n=1 Tax=Parelaphostrongylus tenuis TaxID=148309 RepID=A0AAD5MMU8_PARTN|nr:hypothetical protein KIN20_020715 [Parelaphostrongylus tenuis]
MGIDRTWSEENERTSRQAGCRWREFPFSRSKTVENNETEKKIGCGAFYYVESYGKEGTSFNTTEQCKSTSTQLTNTITTSTTSDGAKTIGRPNDRFESPRCQKISKEKPKKSPVRRKLGSTPIHKKSLEELTSKARRKKGTKQGPKTVNEDSYPRARVPKKGEERNKNVEEPKIIIPKIDAAFLLPETTAVDLTERSVELDARLTGKTLPYTGLPIVQGNNDNNGLIIVNEQPFWVPDIPLDDSAVEGVMNAAVLVEVLEKRLKLVPMPEIE